MSAISNIRLWRVAIEFIPDPIIQIEFQNRANNQKRYRDHKPIKFLFSCHDFQSSGSPPSTLIRTWKGFQCISIRD